MILVLIGLWQVFGGQKNQNQSVLLNLTAADLNWSFTSAGTDKNTQAPLTRVVLTVKDQKYSVGTYTGSCAEVDGPKQSSNEISAVICWFAGGGAEIGVFNENNQWLVKSGEVDEGSAETSGFRGNFKVIKVLN